VPLRILRSLWRRQAHTISDPGATGADYKPDGEAVNASLPISVNVIREDG
jgi:hypothetical protein